MKNDEVQIGGVYKVKVGTAVVPVKITEERWLGEKMAGWVALNLDTRRAVRIKSAQRLRAQVAGGAPNDGDRTQDDPSASDATAATDTPPATNGVVVAAAGSPRPPKAKGGKGAKEKAAKAPKTAKPRRQKKMSGLDAAAAVLAAAKKPMGAKAIVAEAASKGLWKSPGGKTPEASIYAAIIREIGAKGRESRFKKVERGLFAAGKVA